MSRSPRDLDDDDLKVWRHVTRSVTPYRIGVHRHPADPDPPEKRVRTRTPAAASESPPAARPAPPKPPQPLRLGALVDMDKRTAQRFKRGDMAVDGRIDLHGMTVAQAHGALSSFIRGAHGRGARCVLVVTGKGNPDRGGGKIRQETPHWLNQAELRPLVLAVTEARHQHGGSGALYVMLKRKRTS